MISVSDLAKDVLVEALKESAVPADKGLRLQTGVDGMELGIGRPTERDDVITHGGTNVLIVDKGLVQTIGDVLVDVADGDEGPQIVLRRLSRNEPA